MPTIRIQKDELKAYLKQDVDDERLRDRISMLGTDLESFGDEIVVEIFPNRPDLLSVQGLARALNHFLGFTTTLDTYDVSQGSGEVNVLPSVSEVRPHTRCAIVRRLQLDDAAIKQIIEIQEKLHVTFGRNRKKVAIGVYPLEKIQMPITYGAEKPEDIVFTPLEADKEMNAKEMITTHDTGKTYGHLLEECSVFPVFRDATGAVLSVPPIINSEEVGRVNTDTTEVFIECSGHDPRPLEEALAMICAAFSDMGGTLESIKLTYENEVLHTPVLATKTMEIDRSYVSHRASVPEEKLESSLTKMGLSLQQNTVTIPCYRTDFLHQVDVVEDAAIGYGFENIVPQVPELSTTGSLAQETKLSSALRAILSGKGLLEVMTWYLQSEGVELANPLTSQYSHLRGELLEGILGVLAKNTSKSYPQQYFEIGPVFVKDDSQETRVREDLHLSALLCGEGVDYTSIRQVIDLLASALGWSISYEEFDSERFIPGRCARVSGDVKGVLGEIHPSRLSSMNVLFPTAALEITLPR